FFSSRRRHTRFSRDWSSDVCSSDLSTSERLPAISPIRYRTREYPRPLPIEWRSTEAKMTGDALGFVHLADDSGELSASELEIRRNRRSAAVMAKQIDETKILSRRLRYSAVRSGLLK